MVKAAYVRNKTSFFWQHKHIPSLDFSDIFTAKFGSARMLTCVQKYRKCSNIWLKLLQSYFQWFLLEAARNSHFDAKISVANNCFFFMYKNPHKPVVKW